MEPNTLVDLLTEIENSPNIDLLTGIVELGDDYFENTNLTQAYEEFKDKTKYLLLRLKSVAAKNELFESVDNIDEILKQLR